MRRIVCVVSALMLCLLLSVSAFAYTFSTLPVAGYPFGLGGSFSAGSGWFGGVVPGSVPMSAVSVDYYDGSVGVQVNYFIELASDAAAGDVIAYIPISSDRSGVYIDISADVDESFGDGYDWRPLSSSDIVYASAGSSVTMVTLSPGKRPVDSGSYVYTPSADVHAIAFKAPGAGSRFIVRVRFDDAGGNVDPGFGKWITLPFEYFFPGFYDAVSGIVSLPIVKDVLALGVSALIFGMVLKFML